MFEPESKRRDIIVLVLGVWSLILGGLTTATACRVIYDYEHLTFLFGNLTYLLISTLLVLAAGVIQFTSSIALLCQRHLLQRWITLNCYVFLSLILSICICIPITTAPYQKLQQRDSELRMQLQTPANNSSDPVLVYKIGNYSQENSLEDINSSYTLPNANGSNVELPEYEHVVIHVSPITSSDAEKLQAERELIQFVFVHMKLFYCAMLINFIFVPIALGVMARYVEVRFRIVRSK